MALARGSVKKAASAAEAPVWKAYLAVRSDDTGQNAVDSTAKYSGNAMNRGRKRMKPLSRGVTESNVWMTLATPLTSRRSDDTDGPSVLKSIRQYWEQLSVNERQQILFMDEPELVKQLYKLNLSLLCVGLMQRHLKTNNRASSPGTKQKNADAMAGKTSTAIDDATSAKPADVVPATSAQQRSTAATHAATDTASEKTYELLEAMEFMDIGTGILTVKTELAKDTDRLFSLVGDVLSGFLTSIHVLTDDNFNKLFVSESETINTWANYQRLIAMLVEQLILKSYVIHLEKEAAQQMEQLLLEVSLEDSDQKLGKLSNKAKKKSKKKKKKKKHPTVHAAPATQLDSLTEGEEFKDVVREKLGDDQGTASASTTDPEDDNRAADLEPIPEPMPEPMAPTFTSDECYEPYGPSDVDQSTQSSRKGESVLNRSSVLNPNASVFQPQETMSMSVSDAVEARNPYAGKRKFDEYIVSVPMEDVVSDDGSALDTRSVDGSLSDEDEDSEEHSHDTNRRRWRKQRRYEEDAELEWQLQQVYASTASLFGWDFSNQRELASPGGDLPWSTSTLWRTAPKEVVRYFSPGVGNGFPSFQGPQFLPPPGPPPSRYYFHPGIPTPFGQPYVPPGIESLPAPLHGDFGFPPPEISMVVQSPDFSQFHPNQHLQDQAHEPTD